MKKTFRAVMTASVAVAIAFTGMSSASADPGTQNPGYTTKNVKVVNAKTIGKGSKCKSNVTHIGVRGSNEKVYDMNIRDGAQQSEYYRKFLPLYGYGETAGNVTQGINAKLKKGTLVRFHYTSYPADLPDITDVGALVVKSTFKYARSKDAGKKNLIKDIKSLYKACSKTKFSLIGYSQGAQVINEVLRNNDRKLTDHELRAIKSVVLIADPTRNKDKNVITNQPGDFKNRLGSFGVFGNSLKSSNVSPIMKNRIISYCLPKDVICNKSISTEEHRRGYKDNLLVINSAGIHAATRLNK